MIRTPIQHAARFQLKGGTMRPSLFVGVLVALMAACSADLPLTGVADGALGTSGLEQRVTLSADSVMVGDSLDIRSVIINRGSAPVSVTGREGGFFGLLGVAFKPFTGIWAFGYPVFDLRPGDSLVGYNRTTPVTSPPGDYRLTVQQVSSPGVGVTLALRVLPRASSQRAMTPANP